MKTNVNKSVNNVNKDANTEYSSKLKKYKKLIAPAVLVSAVLFGASPSFAYTVKSGDTLSGIASEHGESLQSVIAMNPQIENPNIIFPGQEINTSKTEHSGIDATTQHRQNTDNSGYVASAYEKDLLARLVEAEAGGEPYAGKVAVADVVLNRVHSGEFPNTIAGVIYQQGQFQPVADGSINNPASDESKKAVEDALQYDRTYGSLYFYNPSTATSTELNAKQTTIVIGNHVFKK